MKIDALIFDMDGTLWNATESYVAVWQRCFADFGISCSVTTDELIGYMGLSMDRILDNVINRHGLSQIPRERFIKHIGIREDEMMPQLGGILFPGVAEGIKCLSAHYKLYLLSNCSRYGLKNFMAFTGLTPYFSGSLTYGEHPVQKGDNIRFLMQREGLDNPVYVGDTQGDADETHKAGIPFAYVDYGFGSCSDYQLRFSSFGQLAEYFVNNKEL